MEKPTMQRGAVFFLSLIFAISCSLPRLWPRNRIRPSRISRSRPSTVPPKLTWSVPASLKDPMALKILRAPSSEEGPYQEVEVVKLIPGKSAYDYVDKSMGAESMYFYKLVVTRKPANRSAPLPPGLTSPRRQPSGSRRAAASASGPCLRQEGRWLRKSTAELC